jgi:hypothetical protein
LCTMSSEVRQTTVLGAISILKTIDLPRQAQDKYRERVVENRRRFPQVSSGHGMFSAGTALAGADRQENLASLFLDVYLASF